MVTIRTIKRIFKIGFLFAGMLILLFLPYGVIVLGRWIIEKIKRFPSVNESLKMDESVIAILNNGTQTKKYDSKRSFKKWRKV